MSFIHLHNHSHYSVLDGAVPVDKMVKRAVEFGMNAVALTDHGNMCGAIEFYEAARKAGIKPILGQEFYVAIGSRFGREVIKGEGTNHHLLLLAESLDGYKNLLRLSSLGYTEGYYYKPRIDYELIEKHSKGLICGSACIGGEIPQLILKGRLKEARDAAGKLNEIFGKDHFYLELQDHGIPEQRTVNEELIKMSSEMNIGLIATNDCHYLRKEDAYAHEVLLCIQTGKTMNDPSHMKFSSDNFYFKTEQEMEKIFGEYPDALFNTQKIADMCDVTLELHHPILPTFQVPEGFNLDTYLRHLVMEGAHTRYPDGIPPAAQERIDYELKVVTNMGFPGYFLIVWDFIKYSRSVGIPVGPGRGSAAGSIAAYCLGITQLDPLKYNLLFERFLNPDRKEMPDMDIDFCANRREEVITYVKEKYGYDHVSQIMAYGTMQPKAAFKDVARVMEVPFSEANEITKYITKDTLSESIKESEELQKFIKSGDNARRLMDTAMKLEGLVRSFGRHAAGVVISKDPLSECVPLYRDSKDESVAAQYDKVMVEAAGLVKMDFLGLVNLSIIDQCLGHIKKTKGIDLDLSTIPLDDPLTYKILQDADALGIFQLESGGMQNLLRKLGPTCFDDIVALVALYRPGPLQSGMVDQFIERKRHPEKVEYAHPLLEPVLKDTLGVIVYQEQVMLISRVMGNFSMGESDKLRKAMSKKKQDTISEMKEKFIKGAKELKFDPALADDIYEKMSKFGEYGFNKSHSAAYGLVTYQTAYLKAHYTTEYMAALMSFAAGKQEDIIKYIADCKAHNIEVLAPDVNRSSFDFSIEGDRRIRYGLRAVKGIGDKAIESIVRARQEEGAFTSLTSFFSNIDISVVNKGVLEALIKSGGFDSIHPNRAEMLVSSDPLIDAAKAMQKDKRSGQGSLFGGGDEGSAGSDAMPIVKTAEWPENIKLAFEKEVMGLYISGHPLQKYEKEIKLYSSAGSIIDLVDKYKNQEIPITLAGVLTNQQRKTSQKNGNAFAVAVLEDLAGQVETLFFRKILEANEPLIFSDEPVIIQGKLSFDETGSPKKLIADSIKTIKEARRSAAAAVHIKIDPIGMDEDTMRTIKKVFDTHKGNCPVFFHVTVNAKTGEEKIVKAHNSIGVKPSDELVTEVSALVGKDTVRYSFRNA
jgi:DNA polymerase-3 subunit alpha